MGVAAPSQVSLDRMELNVLATLYGIENDMIEARIDRNPQCDGLADAGSVREEAGEVRRVRRLRPLRSDDRGSAVGTDTIFAMLDALIRLASDGAPANVGVLRLTSRVSSAGRGEVVHDEGVNSWFWARVMESADLRCGDGRSPSAEICNGSLVAPFGCRWEVL